jgi:polysaccharide export outer membrane protein
MMDEGMKKMLSHVLKATFFCLALNAMAFAEESASNAQQPAKAVEAPVREGVKVEVAPAPEAVKPDVVVDSGYQIGPEDVLSIVVWKEEGLKAEVLVRPDGGISFPLIGDLQAAGKTAAQLQDEIAKKLEKFIPDPVVSVSLLKVVGNKIYVIGRVNHPGEFPAGRYIDVMQALSMAGGLTTFAAENGIKVLRKEGGKDVVLPFRYSDVKNGENLEQNVRLKGGDTVVVP